MFWQPASRIKTNWSSNKTKCWNSRPNYSKITAPGWNISKINNLQEEATTEIIEIDTTEKTMDINMINGREKDIEIGMITEKIEVVMIETIGEITEEIGSISLKKRILWKKNKRKKGSIRGCGRSAILSKEHGKWSILLNTFALVMVLMEDMMNNTELQR